MFQNSFPKTYKLILHHRFEALYKSRQEIAKIEYDQMKRYEDSLETIRKYLHVKFEERTHLVTVLESLTSRYNEAATRARRAEEVIFSIHHETVTRKLELVTVKGTCWKLYRHMRHYNYSQEDVKEKDYKGQLEVINKVLGTLRKVLKKLHIPC